jgi:adenosine deaminase
MARVAVALRDNDGLPVVGFDLAGEEAGFPASYHSDAYQYAHSHFMAKTVHAGEAYGPESIFQAITECYANRIGHGTFLFSEKAIRDNNIEDRAGYINQLVEYVASQRITMEVCLTSNQQTIPSLKSLAVHPMAKMLERNLAVSICTDNRLVSHTSVTDEYEIAIKELSITPRQFRNIIIAGFKGAFYGSYNHKRDCVRKVIAQYNKLAKEFGIV